MIFKMVMVNRVGNEECPPYISIPLFFGQVRYLVLVLRIPSLSFTLFLPFFNASQIFSQFDDMSFSVLQDFACAGWYIAIFHVTNFEKEMEFLFVSFFL